MKEIKRLCIETSALGHNGSRDRDQATTGQTAPWSRSWLDLAGKPTLIQKSSTIASKQAIACEVRRRAKKHTAGSELVTLLICLH